MPMRSPRVTPEPRPTDGVPAPRQAAPGRDLRRECDHDEPVTLRRLGAWAACVLVAACTAAPREPPATAPAAESAPGVTTAAGPVAAPAVPASSSAAPAPSAEDESGGSPRSPARPDGECRSDGDCVLDWQYTCDEIYHCRSYRCGYGTPVALPVGANLPAPRCDPHQQLPCTPSPCALPVEPQATCRDHRCVFDGTWPPDVGY